MSTGKVRPSSKVLSRKEVGDTIIAIAVQTLPNLIR